MEDGNDVFFAYCDGMCDGVADVGRGCVFFLACGVVNSIGDCALAISDTRVEAIWRQIIEGFRGGILADWYVAHRRVTPVFIS